jgi:hypothetical protein
MSVGIINQTLTQFGKDTTGKITYTFNLQGFRSNKDFNFIPEYAFFGCSLVFGIGVPIKHVFTSFFDLSQNYGLAGDYNNNSIFDVITQYVKSDIYSPDTRLAVVWTDRNVENLDSYYHALVEYNIKHFFCGKKLPYANCYPVPANIDSDVSGTHMGIKSHYVFYKTLCTIFNQL